jgi:Cys-tRNA(Pro) deacylase
MSSAHGDRPVTRGADPAAGAPPLDLAAELRTLGLDLAIVAPGVPMPTVETAAAAMGVAAERIFKSVLFRADDGRCVMAIACGRWRIDTPRLAALAGAPRLRLAPPEVVLAVTGYPAGGTPPIGHRERFPVFVDTRVAAQDWGWAGGGREELLVRVAPADIVRLTAAQVADLVEPAGDRSTAPG